MRTQGGVKLGHLCAQEEWKSSPSLIENIRVFFKSFLKKCHSGDIKFWSGAPNFNIHPHIEHNIQ